MKKNTPLFFYLFLFISIQTLFAQGQEKPNVLFLIIDDLNADITSVGGPIKTPHIDALAAEGVQFTRMYVQQPVCAASRASFLTGLRPDTTGVDYPYSYYFVEEVQPKSGIISDFFDDKGYNVKQFGKIHHNLPNRFQQKTDSPQSGKFVSDELNRKAKELGGHTQVPYEKIEDGEEGFVDYAVADDVVQELETLDRSKPFCILAGFVKPHLPFSAPKEYWDMYERDEIELPKPKEQGEGTSQYVVDRYYLKQYKWETADPEQPFSDEYARMIRHSYYASSSFVDAQVGRVLDALEEHELDENTVVVLIADHGFLLGEQNYWGKTNLFEKGLKVPFIVSWKKKIEGGVKSKALVEAVDIFPTLVDLSGFEVPAYLEGTSVAPLLGHPNQPWKSGVYSQQPRGVVGQIEGVSLRTDRFRYTEWIEKPSGAVLERELYDYAKDPYELRNLVYDEEYEATVSKLSNELKSGWKHKLPKGMKNDSDNTVAPPSYAWGNEGPFRRDAWHRKFGGNENGGWRNATKLRSEVESMDYPTEFKKPQG